MTATTLPYYDPFAAEAREHPGGALDGSAVVHSPVGYTVMTHELALAVMRDQRFGNATLKLMEDFGITTGAVHEYRARSLLLSEGERHTRLRSPLARFMGPAIVQDTVGVVREILDDIDASLDPAQPIAFDTQIAERIPPRIYCHLADAPVEDAPLVGSFSARVLTILNRDKSLIPLILETYDELWAYLRNLIAQKRADGLGTDLLSHLIRMNDEGKLSDDELLDQATGMLEASSVNTAHQIGLVVWALLRDRDVWARLVADPTLVPTAVVEVLRLYPRPGVISKIAYEDVELDGTLIPQGADIHIAIWSANRDPARFEESNTFVLDRERNQPLTFSSGAHNCTGQNIARLEMEEVVRFLIERYPDAVVLDEGTKVEKSGGRWFVRSLAVDLKKST